MPAPTGVRRTLAALLFALALVLVLALGAARRASPAHLELDSRPYAALDPEGDWRRRQVTLALVLGRAPSSDAFVEPHSRGLAWPPLLHTGAAIAIAWSLERNGPPETGGVTPNAIDAALARFALVVSVLAATLAAALAGALAPAAKLTPTARARARRRAALTAAAVLTLSPLAVAAEHSSAFQAHGLVTLLTLAQLAACAFSFRARERVDTIVGALAAGVFAGASFAAGWESWPVSVACAVAFGLLAVRAPQGARRDAVLSPILYALAALCIASVAIEHVEARELLPAFDGRARGLLAQSLPRLAFVALAAFGGFGVLIDTRRDPFRATLLAGGAVALALALIDARFFAPAHAVLAVALGLGAGRDDASVRSNVQRIAFGCAPATLLFALVWRGADDARLERSVLERDAVRAALEELRTTSPAPGPFNHPDGAQLWRVASAPALAGAIAHRARRPTLAAELEHRTSAGARELASWFALEDEARFSESLDQSGARYVVVCAAMLHDPALSGALGARSMLRRLLDPRAAIAGWTCVHSQGGGAADGPVPASTTCAIWRRDGTAEGDRPAPSLTPQPRTDAR
jgi:hypothetical protein